jgi:hypothetical protein
MEGRIAAASMDTLSLLQQLGPYRQHWQNNAT